MSVRTFLYKGSAENEEKRQVRKRTTSLEIAAQTRTLIFKDKERRYLVFGREYLVCGI